MAEIPGIVAELRALRRELGREHEPFDIMLHCPDANTVDDIRRVEDMGVTDLQVTPWTEPGIQAEIGISAMRVQPPVEVKQNAIKRYADKIIAKIN
jgi:hypothetical protein